MTGFDSLFARRLIGCLVLLLPAVAFGWSRRADSNYGMIAATRNWVWGVIIGLSAIAVFLVVRWSDPGFPWPSLDTLATPLGILTVLGLPIAYELFFRRMVATELYRLSQKSDGARGWDSWIAAVILSAVICALFQVPDWMVFEELTPPQMIVKAAKLAGYAAGFAVFFLVTKSVWSSLLPHWVLAFCFFEDIV